jgi:subtilisin family serine protease
VVGVAPQAHIASVKVLDGSGSGAWSTIIAALQFAVDHGAKITNNSFGSNTYPGTLVEQAYANAEAAGVVNVAAAGNSGNCAGKGDNVGYPARFASVIAVAATDTSNARPCFSSTGPAVAFSAPGVSIVSTIPGNQYASYSGTSMASPHVAGLVALLLSAGLQDANHNGRLSDEVRTVLSTTATDLGAAGRDSFYGYGLVNAPAAVAAVSGSSTPTTRNARVSEISYARQAKNLNVSVTVIDQSATAIAGASVSVSVAREGGSSASGTGTTGSNGIVTFQIKNAAAGCYVTDVTNITGTNVAFDGAEPTNRYCF